MVSLSRGAGRGYCRVAVLPVFHRAAADLPGLSPRVRGNLEVLRAPMAVQDVVKPLARPQNDGSGFETRAEPPRRTFLYFLWRAACSAAGAEQAARYL